MMGKKKPKTFISKTVLTCKVVRSCNINVYYSLKYLSWNNWLCLFL